jgi:hypothetical protein
MKASDLKKTGIVSIFFTFITSWKRKENARMNGLE